MTTILPPVSPATIGGGFLPFGLVSGDSFGPRINGWSSEEIRLGTDVVIFGSRQNRLYDSNQFFLSVCI